MMVLVDTSVWSRALRGSGEPVVDTLRKNIERGRVVLLGIIVQEVLQGIRRERDARVVAKKLEPFPLLQLSRDDHAAAADLHRKCARHGVTVATVDCHIASAATRHDCGLLTADGDFEHIARIARLRLL